MPHINETTDARTGDHYAAIIDAAKGTYVLEVNGKEVERRALTPEEAAAHTPPADPKADLIARVDDATTVAKLRAVVRSAIEAKAL